MIRISLVALIFISFLPVQGQMPYDNCEDALDITTEIFRFNVLDECSSFDGIPIERYGGIEFNIDSATVDMPVYQSQECSGYTSVTTDHFPDIWLKTDLAIGQNCFQQVHFNILDTLQVAVYFGQCGSLYQSQCFTMTGSDSMKIFGVELEYFPHNPEDDIYIQLKFSPQSRIEGDVCFSRGQCNTPYYSFSYDRPATMGGETSNAAQLITTNEIEFFPNPAQDWLNIRSQEVIGTYTITSLMGSILLKGEGTEHSLKLPVDHLSAGMYVFTSRTASGLSTAYFYKL